MVRKGSPANSEETLSLENGKIVSRFNDIKKPKEKKMKKNKKKKNVDEEAGEAAADDEPQLPPVGVFELFKYADYKEKILTIVGCLGAILAGLCMPAMIILFGDLSNAMVYNEYYECIDNETKAAYHNNTDFEIQNKSLLERHGFNDFFQEVVKFGYGTFIVGVVQIISGYIFVTCLNKAAESQVYRLRGVFLKSILKQEIGWFDTHRTNDFASRVTEDLNKLQEGLGEKVGMFVFFFTTFSVSLVNAFVHGWELTLVILSVFPILGVSTGIISKVQASLTTAELKEYARAGSIAEEALSSVRTVVAFGGEEKEIERYEKNLVHARAAGLKRGLMTGVGTGMMWFIIYGSYSLAFWYGTTLTLEGRKPGGDGGYDAEDLIVVFFSVLMGAMNIGQASPYIEAFGIARGAAASIFDIIERESAIDPTSKKGKRPGKVEGTIELRTVHFNYPARKDVKILQGVDILVNPGQTVALVGSSGCGKSTVVQLVQRFYDPDEGSVHLDGVDIRDLNLGWLRDKIGIVGQEPVLFATTIEENIRYGREDVTTEEIENACIEANAHDFIMKLPLKYSTHVGERGVQMSGGQKQRIAIARALVKKPKVLLLDEATSALDNQSEAVVQKALDQARRGRTTLIIAHRLTTIKTADVIIVLDKGAVAETGTHDELIDKGGLYKTLVEAQVAPKEHIDSDDVVAFTDYEDESFEERLDDIWDDLILNSPLRRTSSFRQSSRRFRRPSTKTKSQKRRKAKEKKDQEKEDLKELPPFLTTTEILRWNKKEWHYILGGVIGSAVQGTLIPIYGILFGEVLGTLALPDEADARRQANQCSLFFLVIGIVAAISMFFQAYMFSLSGEVLTMRLRKETFATMLRQEMGWFDEERNSVGTLCSRLSADASAVQGATGSRVGTVIQSIATLSAGVVVALYYSWKLGLMAFPFAPFVVIATYIQSKVLMGQDVTESLALDRAGKIAIEAISNIRTVASLHKEEDFSKKYSDALYEPHLMAQKSSHARGAAFGFAQGIPFISYAAIMLYGGYLVENENVPYKDVLKVAEGLILGTMMVGQAIAFAPNFSKAKLAAARLNALFKRKPKIDTSGGAGLRLTGDVSNIKLDDVHFSYPTRPTQPILKGFSIQVKKGETIALVGSSGSGKSTIINLLQRFYNSTSGQVALNGTNIQALNVGFTRSLFGLVSQEPVLFDRTLAQNIAYGDNTRVPLMEEIIEVAKQANIHTFISKLPNGYDTRVGSKGTQLSGGQKQRIAIARALLRNPHVLLLDEATSALDSESEKIVQETLERVQVGRTSIIIAHRLSTIRNADKIIVLQGGQMVESGTHDELMEQKGEYHKLYETNV